MVRLKGSLGKGFALLLVAVLAHTHVNAAQASGPIRLIVPTPPASASDALARSLTAPWAKESGRSIVVENIAGAGTTIGVARLVRAPNDGLTLGLISANHTINPSLYKNLPYDAIKDITPIMMIGSVPGMLVANHSVRANSVSELASLSRTSEKPLAEGIVSGTAYHMASEVLKDQAGITTNRIPYKGSGQVLNDLLGGTIDLAIVAAQAAAPQVAAGKIKGLAVTTSARTDVAPDIPTIVESGLSDYRVDVWVAIVGPAGMSQESVLARRAEIERALLAPEMQAVFKQQGIQPISMKQTDMIPFLEDELRRNREVIQRVGISVD